MFTWYLNCGLLNRPKGMMSRSSSETQYINNFYLQYLKWLEKSQRYSKLLAVNISDPKLWKNSQPEKDENKTILIILNKLWGISGYSNGVQMLMDIQGQLSENIVWMLHRSCASIQFIYWMPTFHIDARWMPRTATPPTTYFPAYHWVTVWQWWGIQISNVYIFKFDVISYIIQFKII